MKRYIVAKTPTSGYVGALSAEEIATKLRANEISGDFVVTDFTASFMELAKRTDVHWERVSEFVSRPHSDEPAISQPAAQSFSGVGARYSDAYLVARTTSGIGIAVKAIGIILGLLVAIVGIVIGVQHDGAPQFILGGVLLGFIVALPLWVLGVLVCAQAQVLKATLDTAVHGSPFLTKEEMARVMSL